MLRGKQTDAVKRHRHDELALYGIGKEKPDNFWRSVIRQLVARGALRIHGDYASLALHEEVARPILRGEQPVLLAEEAAASLADAAAPTSRSGGSGNAAGQPRPLDGSAESRFQALRAWRLKEARAQAVPPYVIFGDSTLRDIAADQPDTLTTLAEIKGVGASKLDRYGQAVLETLRNAG